MRGVPWALWAVLAAGCQEAESETDVAVSWDVPGRCSDTGADTFALTILGVHGDRREVGCEDKKLTLTGPIGQTLELSAELAFQGEPISDTLSSPEFRVERDGVDVAFDFELEDIRKTGDYVFRAVYQGELGDVDCSILTAQRVTLRVSRDGPAIEGAEVCGADEICTPADGTAGPCRGRDDLQTIPALGWGHYWLSVAGESAAACYSNEVRIAVGFSGRADSIVADLPCE